MQVTLLPSLDASGNEDAVSNSAYPCYKILALRPDKARFSLGNEDQAACLLGRLSRLLGEAPLVLLPYRYMGQPVYVKRGYPAPYLIVGEYLQSYSSLVPAHDSPAFWIEAHSRPFWLTDGTADDALLAVVSEIWDLLYHVLGEALTLRLTGLHLALDVQADYHAVYGDLTPEQLEEAYVTRLISDDHGVEQYRSNHAFGRSKNVRWNVYDKSKLLRKEGKDYYQPVWRQAGWNDDFPVLRVEVQLGKDYFSTHAPQLAGDVSAVPADWLGTRVAAEAWYGYAGAIWADVTSRTRYTLADDSNRSRCTLHPFWQAVQMAASNLPTVGAVKRVAVAVVQSVERDLRAIFGYAKSAAAKLRRSDWIPDAGEIFAQAQSDGMLKLHSRGLSWWGEVADRVSQRAIPLASFE